MQKPFRTILLKSVLFSCFLVATFSASAFTEGTDYVVLEKLIPNADKTLISVSSYDCPFCYRHDKAIIVPVVQKLEGIVKFEPYPLETKAKYGPQACRLFAVLMLKDQATGTSLIDDKSLFKKAKMAYYVAYHDEKKRWDSGEDDFLKTGLTAVGMSRADHDAALKDPRIEEMLQKWKVGYDIARIQGIPAYVVNGKYLIYTKNLKSEDGVVDLIKELAGK